MMRCFPQSKTQKTDMSILCFNKCFHSQRILCDCHFQVTTFLNRQDYVSISFSNALVRNRIQFENVFQEFLVRNGELKCLQTSRDDVADMTKDQQVEKSYRTSPEKERIGDIPFVFQIATCHKETAGQWFLTGLSTWR